VYEGDFIQDVMEGFGVYKYANGDVFRGEFKAGKFEGIHRYDIPSLSLSLSVSTLSRLQEPTSSVMYHLSPTINL